MINADRLCTLIGKHENAFYELFWRCDDITDQQYSNLCKISTQEQMEKFISDCLSDMINVDKITKEDWLSGGLL
jgi:hypothetical protein